MMKALERRGIFDFKFPVLAEFDPFLGLESKNGNTFWRLARAGFDYGQALADYHSDFFNSYLKAMNYFYQAETAKAIYDPPAAALPDYAKLIAFNTELAMQAVSSSMETVNDFHAAEMDKAFKALLATAAGKAGETLSDYVERISDIAEAVAYTYPQAIQEIAGEFGFHFERGGYRMIDETDRFWCYRVLPTEEDADVREDGKPILIVHPYVLGADILAFLPAENKSYVHCFANQGIPTYVRILKPVNDTPAVQKITLEDDIRDMKRFCEKIREAHGRPLTLNGYCQGGLITLSNLLSGELDGLVDTHITCVAPIDGSRSEGFTRFLGNLPDRFNSLEYGTKTLPNGNRVADGDLMSWVYRLKSIETEYPINTLYRDMAMFSILRKKGMKLSKTAAALNYWLICQRHDLPLEITRLSFKSYNHPISEDGTLPFTAFDRPLNIKRLAEKQVPMLICYGEQDRLVEKPTALAPLDYIPAETAPFPKGHVAIATSWSLPTSEYALHTRFGDNHQYRGPVRFHLDMELQKRAEASA